MRPLRRPGTALLAVPLVLSAAACAPASDSSSSSGSASASASASTSLTPGEGECAAERLDVRTPGQLTVGTDSPAYEPWFVGNDPTTGEGYESAVAYEVAGRLGFGEDEVQWTTVGFNSSYAPGPKDFDFDINQISITPQREKVVDFSEGYYTAAQAVVALDGSRAANATSVEDLAGLRLGAQTGTTSLTAVREQIEPTDEPLVFDDTNVAKQALENEQVDAIIADLPTAFYISAAEIPGSTVVGQFQADVGQPEQFGLLFEQGSPLVPCVNAALSSLEDDGTLEQLQQRWLSDVVDVPELS